MVIQMPPVFTVDCNSNIWIRFVGEQNQMLRSTSIFSEEVAFCVFYV